MKEINITRHALMRYASRVYKYQIINDRTFDIWKKQNEDKVEGLEMDLKTLKKLEERLEALEEKQAKGFFSKLKK